MQTFLPYPNFVQSAQCLDYRRLGKQRVEAKQILNILLKRTNKVGWRNHPAVRMWSGFEECLKIYFNIIIAEWITRGYNNTMPMEEVNYSKIIIPLWITEEFCASHRSNLLRKDPNYYGQFGWTEPNNLPYIWPRDLY